MSTSTLDPNREVGKVEAIAVEVLGQDLVHQISRSVSLRSMRADQMHRLYEKGWILEEIGKAWGVSRETVRLELLRYGHTPEGRGSRAKFPQ